MRQKDHIAAFQTLGRGALNENPALPLGDEVKAHAFLEPDADPQGPRHFSTAVAGVRWLQVAQEAAEKARGLEIGTGRMVMHSGQTIIARRGSCNSVLPAPGGDGAMAESG